MPVGSLEEKNGRGVYILRDPQPFAVSRRDRRRSLLLHHGAAASPPLRF